MEKRYCGPQIERLVPVYHKVDAIGLQKFLRENFAVWASNGRCVAEVWNNFKNIILKIYSA
jgi:hypothetical protein